jgi:GNAT superfamily N-acetyltransferase
MEFKIELANATHHHYAEAICRLIEESAKIRGTGIAKRETEYVVKKLESGNAVIALQGETLAGFCYIEQWQHGKYVANSGLIVNPIFRNKGLARAIKHKAFELARTKYPQAKIFGITTNSGVMKINTELGYVPVSFMELTQDDTFWQGCQSCPNYDILQRNNRKLCLCTGMLAPSAEEVEMKLNLTNMILV